MTQNLHLAVALDGTGWHPASWHEPAARPTELFTAGYWLELVRTAERAGLDFVTLEDAFGLQSSRFVAGDERLDQVRGRLDALLLAARLAPLTTRIGLVPTVTVTHTEPFHVATAVQTLDHVSEGRAGWQVRISAAADDAALVGRRRIEPLDLAAYQRGEGLEQVQELFDEAGEAVQAARLLWDSWEDDAVVRDVESGRYLDGAKVHGAGFEGRFFRIEGASITPRSPQGQPPVVALAHASIPFEFAAAHADVVLITPHTPEQQAAIIAELRAAEARLRPASRPPLLILGELLVLLEAEAGRAEAELTRLDGLDGEPLASDALVVAGTPAALVERLLDGARRGLDGYRLRPARLPADLDAIADALVPALRAAGARPPADPAHPSPDATHPPTDATHPPTDAAHPAPGPAHPPTGPAHPPTLRDTLGLPRPVNVFATPAARATAEQSA